MQPAGGDLNNSGQALLSIVKLRPGGWFAWGSDGVSEKRSITLRSGEELYLLGLEESLYELGLAPGIVEVTGQSCIGGEAQFPLPARRSARGWALADGELRSLTDVELESRLASLFLRAPSVECATGCAQIRAGALWCVEPCPGLVEVQAPTPPAPPHPPRACPEGDSCAPFAVEDPCEVLGTARLLGAFQCRPVGAACGTDLRAWPEVGPDAVYVDALGDSTGIPPGRGRPDLQAAIDDPSTTVIAVRGIFDSDEVVLVGEDRVVSIVGLCTDAVSLPPLRAEGELELHNLSITAMGGDGLNLGSVALLDGVRIVGPRTGIQGGPRADLNLREVLLEDVDIGIASQGRLDAEALVVRARQVGISVTNAELQLRRTRVQGLPMLSEGGLYAADSTIAVDHLGIEGAARDAIALVRAAAVIQDLWTHQSLEAAVRSTDGSLTLRRAVFAAAGTHGIIAYRSRATEVEDLLLEQSTSIPSDSDAINIRAEEGEFVDAYTLRRVKISGASFGNGLVLGKAALGTGDPTLCPNGPTCNLIEDLDIQGSVGDLDDSVAVQAGISATVFRRVRIRDWRDVGFSLGPGGYALVEDWSHQSSVRTVFGFRMNNPLLFARFKRVDVQDVVVAIDVAAGDVAFDHLRVAAAGTGLRRGTGLNDTTLGVSNFDIRTDDAAVTIQELARIRHELKSGQVQSQDGPAVLGAECSNPYLGLDQVRLLPP